MAEKVSLAGPCSVASLPFQLALPGSDCAAVALRSCATVMLTVPPKAGLASAYDPLHVPGPVLRSFIRQTT